MAAAAAASTSDCCEAEQDSPLLLQTGEPAPRALLCVEDCDLEEGATEAPCRSSSSRCAPAKRCTVVGAAVTAVIGVSLLGALVWCTSSAHREALAKRGSIVGLNVLFRPTTPAPDETPPSTSAPARPPPDFAIQPPPGFYPDSVTPPGGKKSTSTAPVVDQAPLRPPPDFAIPPPPGFYPDMDAKSGDARPPPRRNPMLRVGPPPAREAPPSEGARRAVPDKLPIVREEQLPAKMAPLRRIEDPEAATEASALAAAPLRRIEDAEAVQESLAGAEGPQAARHAPLRRIEDAEAISEAAEEFAPLRRIEDAEVIQKAE